MLDELNTSNGLNVENLIKLITNSFPLNYTVINRNHKLSRLEYTPISKLPNYTELNYNTIIDKVV